MKKFQNIVELVESDFLKSGLPTICVGDLVRVGVSIQEGNKERIQPFEGTVIAQHKAGLNSTIVIRKVLQGIGVERVFPLHAPCIANLQVLRRAQVSRSKLYYLRGRTGKATRIQEKFETLPGAWKQENLQETKKK